MRIVKGEGNGDVLGSTLGEFENLKMGFSVFGFLGFVFCWLSEGKGKE